MIKNVKICSTAVASVHNSANNNNNAIELIGLIEQELQK